MVKIRTQTIHLSDLIDKIIIAADLHSYIEPLKAFEKCLDELTDSVQLFINGDLFCGGIDCLETIEWVRKRANGFMTRGNHDIQLSDTSIKQTADSQQGAFGRLNTNQLQFMADLPDQIIIHWRQKTIKMMHGHITPNGGDGDWKWSQQEVVEAFANPAFDITVSSHTHFPFIDKYEGFLVANTGSISNTMLGFRAQDREEHYRNGNINNPANTDIRSSFLSITESNGNLVPEIIRFDYDRQKLLARYSKFKGNIPHIFRKNWFEKGFADVALMRH